MLNLGESLGEPAEKRTSPVGENNYKCYGSSNILEVFLSAVTFCTAPEGVLIKPGRKSSWGRVPGSVCESRKANMSHKVDVLNF